MVYFSSYTSQINENEEKIKDIKEEIENIKNKIELNEKVLNTIKDIVILNKVSKIK